MIDVIFPAGYKEIIAPQLTQWDYGQTLRIYGLDLPQIVQVHFCDKSCNEAIVRLGNFVDDHTEVAIPDKLLENAYDNHAFIFVTSYEQAVGVNAQTTGTYYIKSGEVYTAVTLPEDYVAGTTYYRPCGKTVYKITIPVVARTKPENFIDPLTPDEITMLQEMINAVNGTLDDIEALYEETLTIPELQEMIKETKVNDATQADSATNAINAINANNVNSLEIQRDTNGVLGYSPEIVATIGGELSNSDGTSEYELFCDYNLAEGQKLYYNNEEATVVSIIEDDDGDYYKISCSSTGAFASASGTTITVLLNNQRVVIPQKILLWSGSTDIPYGEYVKVYSGNTELLGRTFEIEYKVKSIFDYGHGFIKINSGASTSCDIVLPTVISEGTSVVSGAKIRISNNAADGWTTKDIAIKAISTSLTIFKIYEIIE